MHLEVLSQSAAATKLKQPLSGKEMQLIVFSPGNPVLVSSPVVHPSSSAQQLDGPWTFELSPTLDNRFGDFHWPPTKALIGAEARRMRYADETALDPHWQDLKLDDSKWPTVTCGFGCAYQELRSD